MNQEAHLAQDNAKAQETLPPYIQPGNPVTSDLKVYDIIGGQIRFQNGAMELGRNGATTEEILDVLIAHIESFQAGPYKCRENALVITKLEEAKHWILHRKWAREAQGLKGREGVHK